MSSRNPARPVLPGAPDPRFRQARQELHQLGYFLKGTVLKRMMKCGHPNCACQRDAAHRHGPYFEWTYKVKGKTVNVKLSPQSAPLYQAATKQHRQLKAALARMERLSRTALARLAKQAAHTWIRRENGSSRLKRLQLGCPGEDRFREIFYHR